MGSAIRLSVKELRDLVDQIEEGGGDASILRSELDAIGPTQHSRPRMRGYRMGLNEEEEPTTTDRLNNRVGYLFDEGISDGLLEQIVEMDRNHSLKELKMMCVEAGLSPNGDKKELAAKLMAHENSTTKLLMTLTPTGACYEDAWRFLIKEDEGELIHGSVQTIGRRINHAWIELPTGYIWEPESGEFMKKEYFYERAEPKVEARYSVEEAAIMLARTKNFGPWTKEEESLYLRKAQ